MATLKEQDIVLHTTDSSGNPVIQLPVTRLENVEGQDSKLVHTTGNETVAGTKTFSSSPIAPTPTAGDNSTKVATTAFVTTVGNAKAPTSHASTATTYGIGTGSNYGHVKLSDSTSSTSAASAGIAASPKAVKAAYDLANTAKTNAAMAQTTADACLPLIGGTVTGAVTIQHGYRGLVQKLPSDAIYTDHAFLDKYGNLYANIRVTKNDNGSSNIGISANGKDANGSTTWCSLEVGANSDGSSPFIKFNGYAVLTNKTGLPLTGGEMTGQIVFNKSECLLNTKESNQDMRIGGGAGYSTGTVLYMFGKDSTRGQGFYLRTVNKDNQVYELKSDGYGSLTWDGHSINQYLNPKVSSSIAVDGTEVTIAFDGLLIVSGHVQNLSYGGLSVYLDGVMIVKLGGNDYDYNTLTIPVQKGQTFKAVSDNASSSSAKLWAFK